VKHGGRLTVFGASLRKAVSHVAFSGVMAPPASASRIVNLRRPGGQTPNMKIQETYASDFSGNSHQVAESEWITSDIPQP
jgi:hypothetical protein